MAEGAEEVPLDKMTPQQLIQEVTELELDLRERDDEIQRLTRELQSAKSGKGGAFSGAGRVSVDDEAVERENEVLREALAKAEGDASRYQEQLSEMNAQLKVVVSEKIQTEEDLKRQRVRVTEVEREVLEARDSSRTALLRTQDVSKQKTENQKQQLRLLQESENMQLEIRELQRQLEQEVAARQQLEEVISKLAEERDGLEEGKENAEIAREGLEAQLLDMQAALEASEGNAVNMEASEVEMKLRLEHAASEHEAQMKAATLRAETAEREVEKLKRQVQLLRDTTALGSKQLEVDELTSGRDALAGLLQEMKGELESAVQERDQLAERLIEFERGIEMEVELRVVAEKEASLLLERRLTSAQDKLAAETDRASVLESEKHELAAEVDELTHWKSVYESGHGLQELARMNLFFLLFYVSFLSLFSLGAQKKLKQDNRRLGIALEQVTRRLGEAIDGNGILMHAYEKLRKSSGSKEEENPLDNPDLKLEVLGDNARLRAMLQEQELQIEALEADAVRVRRALQNQAGSIGEQGFRFGGMDADMLLQVNDYATSLREGRAGGVPVEPRLSNVLKENRKLKEDLTSLQSRLELTEVEGGVLSNAASSSPLAESQLKGLRDDMKRLLSENGELKNRLGLMQDELIVLLNRKLSMDERDRGGMSAAIMASNEALLGHLEDMKLTQRIPEQLNLPQPLSPVNQGNGMEGISKTGRRHGALQGRPQTAQGNSLLAQSLLAFNLPPEEWAEEVKVVNAELVEALEQLFEREAELTVQQRAIQDLETTLIAVKQQTAALYYDFGKRSESWRVREKQLKAESATLNSEKEDLLLRLKRAEETLALLQKEDPAAVETKLREQSKRLAIYEVNEAILSRRYTAQADQLKEELQRRQDTQLELAETQAVLKRRVLYLEACKTRQGSRLEQLEERLLHVVPASDMRDLMAELERLREDHLECLQRESDTRGKLLNIAGQSLDSELQKAALETSKGQVEELTLKCELQEQELHSLRLLHQRSLSTDTIPSDIADILDENTRYRKELNRMEIELGSKNRSLGAALEKVRELIKKESDLKHEFEELSALQQKSLANELSAKSDFQALSLKFDGGLSRVEAEHLKLKIDDSVQQLASLQNENVRLRGLAEVATQQAQALMRSKNSTTDDMADLLRRCSKIESLGDDELIIGKLQRQLLSTKASYKAFAHKYHELRSDMGQRELAIQALEHRLDSRESAALAQRKKHRLELGIVRKAMQDLVAGEGTDHAVSRLGQKMSLLAHKMKTESELVSAAVVHTLDLEERTRQMVGSLQDIEAEKDFLQQRCKELASIGLGGREKQQQIAGKLVALGEEIRMCTLNNMRQKRELSVLAAEKRHFQSLLSAVEASVRELEENKVRGEAKLRQPIMLSPPQYNDGEDAVAETEESLRHLKKLEDLLFSERDLSFEETEMVAPHGARVNAINSQLSAEILLGKLQGAAERVTEDKRALDSLKAESEHRLRDLEELVSEQKEAIHYYETVLQREGLPILSGVGGRPGQREGRLGLNAQQELLAEHGNIQAAVAVTIGSLKSLLEEKNETISRLQDRLSSVEDNGGGGRRVKSIAERNADLLLADQSIIPSHHRGSPSSFAREADDAQRGRLLRQIEDADELLMEKDSTIKQLEGKLAAQTNARERAEVRCGTALSEMEAMKRDMVTLVRQLQHTDGRSMKGNNGQEILKPCGLVEGKEDEGNNLTKQGVGAKQLNELRKLLKSKDEKIRGYRDIIVRLKEEFIKTAEERAQAAVRAGDKPVGAGTMVNRGELEELKAQVSALKDGLRNAKEDLEAAKKTREKLTRARMQAQEETERLDAQMVRSEAQAASALESVSRLRKELEESRKKEAQLRGKLKDMAEGGSAPPAGSGGDKEVSQEKMEALRKEVQVLRAQNVALRRQEKEFNWKVEEEEKTPSSISQIPAPRSCSTAESKEASSHLRPHPKKVIEAEAAPLSDKVELRAQMQGKWEADKKLEKRWEEVISSFTKFLSTESRRYRLGVLEKRLQAKNEECDELTKQLTRAKNLVQGGQQLQQRDREREVFRGAEVDDGVALEALRRRIFELEDVNSKLRKRLDVDVVNDLASLRHQLRVARTQCLQLSREKERIVSELESSRKEDDFSSGQRNHRSIRDSEDRYIREERLREEVAAMRQERIALEGSLLDKDSRLLELRFEVESSANELERLRRRCGELESAYRLLSEKALHPTEKALTSMAAPSGSRRELELEAVVEATRKVAEKLKLENERLRRGGTPEEKRLNEADKRAQTEKKRADGLDAELKIMSAKLKSLEDVSQKLAQRQQQVALLRKQIKTKDDELSSVLAAKRAADTLVGELKSKATRLEDRVLDLEAKVAESQLHRGFPSNEAETPHESLALRRKIEEQDRMVQELRKSLYAAQQENLRQKMGATDGRPGADADNGGVEAAQVRALREENARLKEELSAFDLDFFEEIENLKYAHAEAVRKLRILEQQQPRR